MLDKQILRCHVNKEFPRSPHSICDVPHVQKQTNPNCCSHETLFREATCGFKRRSAVNYALNSGVRKTHPPLLQVVWFLLASSECRQFSVLSNLTFTHQGLLGQNFNRLDQFCPCISIFWTNFHFCSFVNSFFDQFYSCVMFHWTNFQFCPFINKAPPNGIHHDLPSCIDQVPNYTLSCGVVMVLAQYTWFGHRSDSPVLTFWKLEQVSNSQMLDFSQPEPVDNSNCCGRVIFNSHMPRHTEVVQNRLQSHTFCCCPHPPLANSDSPPLKATTHIVLEHAFTNWPLHIATPPTMDLLMEYHPAKIASPNTSILLSNWVHGHLQVIRGYLMVYRATLLEGSEVLCTW